jgi:hypothetical protein
MWGANKEAYHLVSANDHRRRGAGNHRGAVFAFITAPLLISAEVKAMQTTVWLEYHREMRPAQQGRPFVDGMRQRHPRGRASPSSLPSAGLAEYWCCLSTSQPKPYPSLARRALVRRTDLQNLLIIISVQFPAGEVTHVV